MFDRGYRDYKGFLELSRRKLHFVTQMKGDASYGVSVVEGGCRPVDASKGLLRDEDVVLTGLQEQGPQAIMRRVEIWVEEKQATMALLTNNRKLSAVTIAGIYRDRWQIA